MKVLVAGGAGYIGSIVVYELIHAGHQVVVYDNLSRGHRRAVHPAAVFVHGDIQDRPRLDQTMAHHQPEAVMHFAALIEVGESMQQPLAYLQNNTANTFTLLQSAIDHNVRKLVFSSTAAVYGVPHNIPILEDDPLQPVNVYGDSKLIIERTLAWCDTIYGLKYAALRYFNAAGALAEVGEDHHPETHLIPIVLQVALGRRPSVNIYGTDYPTPDGTAVRDYIHVVDLAQAHLLALAALDQGRSQIYNIGNGLGFSVHQVIEVARRVTGHPIPAQETPRRAGDPPQLVASSARIRQELGWQPRYPGLESIIASAWEWRRRHPYGYEDPL
ncbi:MAG: UDP-glucose 4-epimerase GalE [Chloroflexi bacterium]|nr:UDP-glucose 4-epimerase GalE [Chloroflexota bacterium]